MVFAVPPVSWMLNVRSSGPSRSCCAPSSALIWFDSQPSPTMSTPAKFACRAYPPSVRRSTCMPSPFESIPQPEPWVSATTPSTLGYAASASPRNASAMPRTTVAEQLTVDRMPT